MDDIQLASERSRTFQYGVQASHQYQRTCYGVIMPDLSS